MELQNYFYTFPSAVPIHICDEIIQHGKDLKDKEVQAFVKGISEKNLTKQNEKELKKIRDSHVVWMEDLWLYKLILPFVNDANEKAGWNFQWDWSESCQFTIYRPGQHYTWHCDSSNEPYKSNDKNFVGKIRKLSVTLSLSDSHEYEGGRLEFDLKNVANNKKQNIIECTEILPKGSLVVFPSHVWHRVKPVKTGTRYSLVIWNIGYPFK